jgi:hypothetical protein
MPVLDLDPEDFIRMWVGVEDLRRPITMASPPMS